MAHDSFPVDPPPQAQDYEPFVPGREVRTFTQQQWVNLMAGMKPAVRQRTQRAARMVLVDRMSYKLAAIAAGETQAMVRGATLVVMERAGLLGTAWYQHNPDFTLVLRDIPPAFHGQVRDAVERLREQWTPKPRVVEIDTDAGWAK